MPCPRGGKLIIETGNVTIEHEGMLRLRHPELRPGDYVEISVSDTGTGMKPEVQQRAFEPFFTTKSRGHGTGLGLSMIHGFARQSGGDVTIYSEEGHGTTVKLYLPRLEASDSVAEAKTVKEGLRSTGERILVVEDDERVRNLTVKRLTELGYEVLQAPDGVTAINMLEEGLRVDLVFTDVIMPGGVSGFDVIQRATRARSANEGSGDLRLHGRFRRGPGTGCWICNSIAAEAVPPSRVKADHSRSTRIMIRLHQP